MLDIPDIPVCPNIFGSPDTAHNINSMPRVGLCNIEQTQYKNITIIFWLFYLP